MSTVTSPVSFHIYPECLQDTYTNQVAEISLKCLKEKLDPHPRAMFTEVLNDQF